MRFIKTLPDDYRQDEVSGLDRKGCLQVAIPLAIFWGIVILLIVLL